MAQGLSNTAIAARLVVGLGAVEKRVTGIFGTIGLADDGTENRRVLAGPAWLGSR